jgi:hypothetical protein
MELNPNSGRRTRPARSPLPNPRPASRRRRHGEPPLPPSKPDAFISMFRPQLQPHHLGFMIYECEYCLALRFVDEISGSKSRMEFEGCCKRGDVDLPLFWPPPPYLWKLFTEQDQRSKAFQTYIRQYNASIAFASAKLQRANFWKASSLQYLWRVKELIFHYSSRLEFTFDSLQPTSLGPTVLWVRSSTHCPAVTVPASSQRANFTQSTRHY